MAVDVEQVQSAAIPESAPVATPEAAPASPPVEAPRSAPIRERLAGFFRKGEESRTPPDAGEQDARTPEPTVAPEPPTTERPRPALELYTQEEIDRYEQSVYDRRHAKAEKAERDRRIADLQDQQDALAEQGNTWEAGEIAAQIAQLRKGVKVEQTQAQTQEQIRAQIAEAHQQARFQTAADLDDAYTSPFLSQLTEGSRKETMDWYAQQAKKDQADPIALRQKFAERAATALYEQGRDEGRNEVLDKVDPASATYDPEFAKLVRATQMGGIEEPPIVSGGATPAGNYATHDELVIAHAQGAVNNQEFRRQAARFR